MSEDVPDDDGKVGWLIVGFVVCLFLGMGLLGWYYRSNANTPPICADAQAHCGDKADGTAQ